MKTIFIYLILLLFGCVSCKNEEQSNVVSTNPETSAFSDGFKGPTATPSITSTAPSTSVVNPPTVGVPNGTTNQNQQQPQPVKVGKGMNPPHGQPGHRCDIAVGAPLNSPPAKTTSAVSPSGTISSAGTTTGTVVNNGATITTTNNLPETIAAPVEKTPETATPQN